MRGTANLKRQIFKGIGGIATGLLFFTILGLRVFALAATMHSSMRVAVIDFAGDAGERVSSVIRNLARSSPSIELVDENMVQVAARGVGYAGSLNLSLDEARALGQSLGCDFYILGRAQIMRRLETGDRSHFEALAGVFIVETRTGRLLHFAFERPQGQSEQGALDQLEHLIENSWANCINFMRSAQEKHQIEIENAATPSTSLIEISNEIGETGGDHQPVFYQRLKPSYTEQAELAGITATVELEAVFREDGRVGEIRLVRWAGYGLDESAILTVQQLRFKPAERDGKLITIRGLVRYNFRRPQLQVEGPTDQRDVERLKRSLREIKNAGQVPGRRPDS